MQQMSQFLTEILEQPNALRRLLKFGREPVLAAAERFRDFAPDWVLIAARGSSDNAARYAQYLLGAHNRLGVGLALPSLISLYHCPPSMGRAAVIGISQSGQSPDIVAVLEEARRQGALTLSVTNDTKSPLARACSMTLPLFAGVETAVAASKTYTSELAALAMLSAAIEGATERFLVLEQLPAYVEEVILSVESAAKLAAESFANAGKLVVLGRGFNYCTAFEIALKIKETCSFIAEPYSVADLLHGPMAMIGRDFPVAVVAPSGPTQADIPNLLTLLEQRGARTLIISDRADLLARADHGLKLPSKVPEWATPIVAVVAGQLFAHALCLASGQDPDKPRGLSKVTLTQ
jgi:glutamine---fructose-6-phosphate transaminase (isomerizing)